MIDEPPSIVDQAEAIGCHCAFYDFRKAKVPGIDYYNPALLQRDDGLWLITRRSCFRHDLKYGFNDLMTFKLDDLHLPQFGFPIRIPSDKAEHFEDPRITIHNGRYFLSATNFIIYPNRTWTGAHQALIEIDHEWRTIKRYDPVYGGNRGKNPKFQRGDEKNWLWFSHDGALHMIYMTRPHVVLRWNEKFSEAEEWTTKIGHPAWKHGQPRGGSAPIRIGDEYFSFFHSSIDWRGSLRRYAMGAYAFEAKPPFTITRMTTKPLLVGSLNDPWALGKPLVVFPCAAILNKEWWTVSLGVNDMVSAHFMIPHHLLSKKLDRNVTELPDAVPARDPLEKVFA